jgi:hypothetical protein
MTRHKAGLFTNGITNAQHSFEYTQVFHNSGWQNQAIRTTRPDIMPTYRDTKKPFPTDRDPHPLVGIPTTSHPLDGPLPRHLNWMRDDVEEYVPGENMKFLQDFAKPLYPPSNRTVGDGTMAKYLSRTNVEPAKEPITKENVHEHMELPKKETEEVEPDKPKKEDVSKAAPIAAAAAGGGGSAAAGGAAKGSLGARQSFMGDAQNLANIKSITGGLYKNWANNKDIELQSNEHQRYFDISTGQMGHFHGMHTIANLETLAMSRAHDRVKNYRNTGEAIGGPLGGIVGWAIGHGKRAEMIDEERRNSNFKIAHNTSSHAMDPRKAPSSTWSQFKQSSELTLDGERANKLPKFNELMLNNNLHHGISLVPNQYNGFPKVIDTNIPPPSKPPESPLTVSDIVAGDTRVSSPPTEHSEPSTSGTQPQHTSQPSEPSGTGGGISVGVDSPTVSDIVAGDTRSPT